MEVRTTAASSIFRGACALHGQPWSHRAGEDSLSITDFRMIRSLLSDRLNVIWHTFPWPAVIETKTRQRLPDIFEARLYHPGDMVLDAVTNACYVCVEGTTGPSDEPGKHPELWARLGCLPVISTNDPEMSFKIGDRVLNPNDNSICYVKRDGTTYADIPLEPNFYVLPDWNSEFPLEDNFQAPMEEVLSVWCNPPRM